MSNRTNKKEQQQQKKAAHKAQKRAAKRARRAAQGLVEPEVDATPPLPRILMVCEGGNTEPSYFSLFEVKNADIEIVGTGYNTISLVQKAHDLVQAKAKDGIDFDQVWCVFDKDDFSNNDFNNAILMAKGYGYKIAYSNQAFEYWFYLHFFDHQGGQMDRAVCCEKFSDWVAKQGYFYDCDRGKSLSKALFDYMRSINPNDPKQRTFQQQALQRAQRNHQHHCSGPYPRPPRIQHHRLSIGEGIEPLQQVNPSFVRGTWSKNLATMPAKAFFTGYCLI